MWKKFLTQQETNTHKSSAIKGAIMMLISMKIQSRVSLDHELFGFGRGLYVGLPRLRKMSIRPWLQKHL